MTSEFKGVRVSDLKDQTNMSSPYPSLHCDECGCDYSANKGDYFMVSKDRVFTCCGENMRLVKRVVSLIDVPF